MTNPIDDLTQAILTGLEAISDVVTAIEYLEDLTEIKTPAILLEEASFEMAEDDGTGRLPLQIKYIASVVISRINSTAEKQTRNLAIEVLKEVHSAQNRGIEGVELPDIQQAEPDPFEMSNQSGKGQGFEVWTVEWTHDVFIGASVWDETGVLPDKVFVSHSPKIGTEHKDDYVQVTGAEDV